MAARPHNQHRSTVQNNNSLATGLRIVRAAHVPLIGVQRARGGGSGGVMFKTRGCIAVVLLSSFAVPAMAQSFRVQCPTSTITHPSGLNNNDTEPAYKG